MSRTITLLSATNATASPVVTNPLDLNDLNNFSLQVGFSGGGGNLVGTLTLEASDDNVTYATVANSSVAVTASTANMYNVQGAGYRYVRVRWVLTSGTGNISVIAFLKDTVIKGV